MATLLDRFLAACQQNEVTPIRDLQFDQDFIVCGVVESPSVKKPSQGTDYYLSVSLIDPSCPLPLKTTLFRPSNLLPAKAEPGDIVYAKRLKIQPFNNKKQGVLSKKEEPVLEIYGASTEFPGDVERVHLYQLLREWWLKQSGQMSSMKQPVRNSARPVVTVASIEPGFDQNQSDGGKGRLTLLVTDYTANPLLRSTGNARRSYYKSDIHPELPSDMIFPCTLWDDHVNEALNYFCGDFVSLINVRSKNFEGLEGNIHGERGSSNWRTGIHALKLDDEPVVEIRRRCSNLGLRPHPFTRIGYLPEEAPLAPVEAILKCAIHPSLFRIKGYIVDYLPTDTAQFLSANSDEFLFSFLVQDASGFLPVIISGEDALFFLQLPPQDSYNADEIEILQQILETVRLKRGREMDMCVQSYLIRHGNDDVPRYKLRNTKLVW
ncbi:hypothetical protein HDU76_012585 [Blyttiomyces sp. JEL0837]|nr:hypothetical protein HDU76_012585 [Blyttiomyces sp. JEL0837]